MEPPNEGHCAKPREKLAHQLNQVLDQQLFDLLINRHIWGQLMIALRTPSNDDQGLTVLWFIKQCFIAYAGTAIRRIVDEDSRAFSLVNFLKELKQADLSVFSRCEYGKGYCPNITAEGERQVIEQFASRDYQLITNVEASVNADLIDKDIEYLKGLAKPIRRLVDKVIAHTERNAEVSVQWTELYDSIDGISTVYKRYAMLIGSKSIDLSYIEKEYEVADAVSRLLRIKDCTR